MIPSKQCSTCREVKFISCFHFNAKGKYGRCFPCRSCRKKQYKPPARKAVHRKNIKVRYGLSLEQYEQLVNSQSGCCGICKERMEPVCVDHCHDTGKVRGLLCRNCNSALGKFKDSPETLRSAADYIEKFSLGRSEPLIETEKEC